MIIGVDPGGTTGIAWWDETTQQLEATVQQPAQHAVVTLWAWLEEHAPEEPVEVAVEKYDISSQTLRSTRQYDALEVTGAVHFKCTQLGVPYKQYGRASAKRLGNDTKLKKLGLYRPGRPHATDAVRQVIAHLGTTRPRVLGQLVLDADDRLG